jgi:hypothetical protein
MQYVLHSSSLAFLHPGIWEVLVPNMNTFADFFLMGVADFLQHFFLTSINCFADQEAG